MNTKNNFSIITKAFFSRGLLTKTAFAVVIIFLFMAVFAPVITPFDPNAQDLLKKFDGPSWTSIFGKDLYGRDEFSRIVYGARTSISICLMSGSVAVFFGVLFGLIAGFFKGIITNIILSIIDTFLAIPSMIFTLVIATILGSNATSIVFAIGLSMVPTYVRLVYSQVLSLRENDYVLASALVGVKKMKLILTHILPNCLPTIIVVFTMNLGNAIMTESTLSFLGVGIQPPASTWGTMVADGYQYLLKVPILAIIPGICITLLVIAFNIVGDALRDALDPRLRGYV